MPGDANYSVGNTSTGVEKTKRILARMDINEKHLHGRGENSSATGDGRVTAETPPRAWRKPNYVTAMSTFTGNTSTGVEKTEHP